MLEDLLDKTLNVVRLSAGVDAVGAPTQTPVTRLANVPCTLWPATARTVETFAKLNMVATVEVVTAADIGAAANDTIVVDGRTLTVIGYEPFENDNFGQPVYLTVCGRRNQT